MKDILGITKEELQMTVDRQDGKYDTGIHLQVAGQSLSRITSDLMNAKIGMVKGKDAEKVLKEYIGIPGTVMDKLDTDKIKDLEMQQILKHHYFEDKVDVRREDYHKDQSWYK